MGRAPEREEHEDEREHERRAREAVVAQDIVRTLRTTNGAELGVAVEKHVTQVPRRESSSRTSSYEEGRRAKLRTEGPNRARRRGGADSEAGRLGSRVRRQPRKD